MSRRSTDGLRLSLSQQGLPVLEEVLQHANIRQFIERNKYTLPVFSTTAAYTNAFNAVWTPRAAAVDPENRLIWIDDAVSTSPVGVAQQFEKPLTAGKIEGKR